MDIYVNPADPAKRELRPLSAAVTSSLSSHIPSEETANRIEVLRRAQKEYAQLLENLCPEGKVRGVAMTHFETHCMWAIKSLAISHPIAG